MFKFNAVGWYMSAFAVWDGACKKLINIQRRKLCETQRKESTVKDAVKKTDGVSARTKKVFREQKLLWEVSKKCVSTAGVSGKYWGHEHYRNLPSGWLCCSCGGGPLDDITTHQGKPPNAKTEMCNILREYDFLQLFETCSYGVFPTFF